MRLQGEFVRSMHFYGISWSIMACYIRMTRKCSEHADALLLVWEHEIDLEGKKSA